MISCFTVFAVEGHGCRPCTDRQKGYCLSDDLLSDHCTCDHRHVGTYLETGWIEKSQPKLEKHTSVMVYCTDITGMKANLSLWHWAVLLADLPVVQDGKSERVASQDAREIVSPS